MELREGNTKQKDGENYIMKISMTFLFAKIYLSDKIKEDKDGRACSTHEIRKYINILVGNPRGNIPFGRSKNKWEI